jgi:hypothetical protein
MPLRKLKLTAEENKQTKAKLHDISWSPQVYFPAIVARIIQACFSSSPSSLINKSAEG